MSAKTAVAAKTEKLRATLEALRNADPKMRRYYLQKNGYSNFLYKYRYVDPADPMSVSRLRSALVDSQIWFSSPVDFNDPFDMSANIVSVGSQSEKIARLTSLVLEHQPDERQRVFDYATMYTRPDSEWEPAVRTAFEKNVEAAGVYCLAGDPRSILMWSHYAKDHAGLCIQFCVADDVETFTAAIPVEYSDTYPTINWIAADFQDQIRNCLLRKHANWSYEKESRIIAIGEKNTPKGFLPIALQAIIFGCRASNELIACVKALVAERVGKGMPPVQFYKATKHPQEFRLVLRKTS